MAARAVFRCSASGVSAVAIQPSVTVAAKAAPGPFGWLPASATTGEMHRSRSISRQNQSPCPSHHASEQATRSSVPRGRPSRVGQGRPGVQPNSVRQGQAARSATRNGLTAQPGSVDSPSSRTPATPRLASLLRGAAHQAASASASAGSASNASAVLAGMGCARGSRLGSVSRTNGRDRFSTAAVSPTWRSHMIATPMPRAAPSNASVTTIPGRSNVSKPSVAAWPRDAGHTAGSAVATRMIRGVSRPTVGLSPPVDTGG